MTEDKKTEIISDEQLLIEIDKVVSVYTGQIDRLYEAVGMIVVGRLLGWKVMRLVSSRKCWSLANDLFGDPKKLMDHETKYSHRSLGLRIVEKIGGYWDIINGNKSRDDLSNHDRKSLLTD